MSKIIFYDPVCPKPYSPPDLVEDVLGGTEATVIRVAEALAAEHNVCVMQHNRTQYTPYKAEYRVDPFTQSYGMNVPTPDHVVVLRDPVALLDKRKQYPNATLHLWLHDLPDAAFVAAAHIIPETRAKVICVSDFHKSVVMSAMRQGGVSSASVSYIYNPVDLGGVTDVTGYDENKLIFFSSPHKGLKRALELFAMVHRVDPRMRLVVANPGYLALPPIDQDGVTVIGPRPHKEVLEEVASSLCVFYPNAVFPETFGLVFAEANALGTPVLTHSIGSAREVLYHPSELIDTNNYKAVVDRVLAWKSGNRPKVKGKVEFTLPEVIKKWNRILS